MNLLIIHQAFVPPTQPGGTRHFELANHCIAQGHRVSIVASDLDYLTGTRRTERARLLTIEHLGNLRVLRAYTFDSLHRSFVWRVFSFLTFMVTSVWAGLRAGPVDLVMGTSPPIFQTISAWLVSVILWRPFLLEIRDLWPEFAIDMGVLTNPVLITMSRWLERFLYARATHLLVNSPAYRDYLIAKGISPTKISLIANGVDSRMFDPDADGGELRARLGLEDRFVVIYAGALGIANDIETLLRAADRLREEPNIQFLVIGAGKERWNLEREASRLGLPNLRFVGTCPKSEIPLYLSAADACVAILQDTPMFRTTYPNKVFDYMAAARPTVLAIDGVIRSVVEAAEGGIFVAPGDDAALAAAVRCLANDRQSARLMGQSARRYVQQHFNRQQQAHEFVELVERLAARRSAQRDTATAATTENDSPHCEKSA